jgi:glutathione S-transferase
MTTTTKIWARRSSSNAQKVFWTLAELQVPHEQINAGAKYGVVDDAEYRRKNPNGLVPTLEEGDGFVLWESNAIVRYLADRYGRGSLQPSAAQERARSDSWMDWNTTTLEPSINQLWKRLVITKLQPEAADETLAANAVKALKLLAERLPATGYVLGQTLSIGDIPLGVLVNRWFNLPVTRPELPRIRAYHELLSTRAAYREHVVGAPPPLT